jgi:hypothetical protein
MTEEEKRAKELQDAIAAHDASEKKRKDGAEGGDDTGAKLDKLLTGLDSLCSRMDALETSDKARKDAEGKDALDRQPGEPEHRADSAEDRAKKRVRDEADLAHAQARADAVCNQFGKQAPAPMQGETVMAYRARLAGQLQYHCAEFKEVDLRTIARDPVLFAGVEGNIYSDAAVAARTPTAPIGELRAIAQKQPSGHTIITYHGEPAAWMNQFSGPVRNYVTGDWAKP